MMVDELPSTSSGSPHTSDVNKATHVKAKAKAKA